MEQEGGHLKEYTVREANKLNEDAKYGSTFWCTVEEQLEPVMFRGRYGSL